MGRWQRDVRKVVWGYVCMALLLWGLSGCNNPRATETPTPASAPVKTLRIFWVNSYSEDDIWAQQIQTGLRETLALNGYVIDTQHPENGTLIWSAYHLDALNHMNAMHRLDEKTLTIRVNEAVNAIQDFAPDVVVISDDEAVPVIRAYPDPGLPFVFCGVSGDPHAPELAHPSATGVLERPHAVETVRLAQSFASQSGRFMILSDGSPAGWAAALEAYRQVVDAKLSPQPPLLRVTSQWETWQQAILTETAGLDFVLLARHQAMWNEMGKQIAPREVFTWTWKNSTVPLFGLWEETVRDGAVGGLTISPYDQGREAARTVLRIFTGKDMPSSIRAYAPERNVLAINTSAVRHWHLPLAVEFPITAQIYRSQPEGGE